MVRHDLGAIMRHGLPLRVLTDSSSLFSVVVKSTITTEKRLMNDLHARKEAFERKDLTEIGWIRRELNFGDGLKNLKQSGPLTNFLATHTLDNEVIQWVVREHSPDTSCMDMSDEPGGGAVWDSTANMS